MADSVKAQIQVQDKLTAPVRNMVSIMEDLVQQMKIADTASEHIINQDALTDAGRKLNDVGKEVDETARQSDRAGQSTRRMGEEGEQAGNRMALSFTAAQVALKALHALVNTVTSAFSGAFDRIDTGEQFLRVQTALLGNADAAAAALERVRDGVTGTAYSLDAAAKAVNAFSPTRGISQALDDIEALQNATSFWGDGTSSTLSQVSEAWAKMATEGKVSARTVMSLTNAGIPVWQTYASAVGQSVADVQAAVSAGEISVEQFQNTLVDAIQNGTDEFPALANAAQEAGQSWAGTWDNMKAAVVRGVAGIVESIDEVLEKNGLGNLREQLLAAAKGFEAFLNTASVYIVGFIDLVLQIYQFIQPGLEAVWNGFQTIIGVIGELLPVVAAVAAAFLAYHAVLLIVNAATYLKAAADAVVTAATMGWYAAQSLLNKALLANPIGFVVAAIVVLVGVITQVVAATKGWGDTTTTVAGRIAGTISVLGAFIYNAFVGVINGILQFLSAVTEPFISIIEFIINAWTGGFDSFGDAVANLIGNIIGWFLSLGQVVTRIIDAIFGTDWTSGLQSLKDNVTAWGKNENAITLERPSAALERKSYEEAYKNGAEFGDGLFGGLEDLAEDTDGEYNWDQSSMADSLAEIADSTAGTDTNTGKIADIVSANDAELDYLKRIAERQGLEAAAINVTVEMNNMQNTVQDSSDIDGLSTSLAEEVAESVADILISDLYGGARGLYA